MGHIATKGTPGSLAVTDIHWLAGIVEGEGCFTYSGGSRSCPVIRVRMTDLDVIERVHRVWRSVSSIVTEKKRQPHWKTSYETTVRGKLAIQWAMVLYTLMGKRRQQRIRDLVSSWREGKPCA